MIPVIFLMVAAFLLNVVLSRMVSVQREEIAVLKAVGYSNAAVAGHFVKWAMLITIFGSAFGIVVGAWLGRGMTEMYTDFFDFPILIYPPQTCSTIDPPVRQSRAGSVRRCSGRCSPCGG